MTKDEVLNLLVYDIRGFTNLPKDSDLLRDPDIIEAAIELSGYDAYQYMHPDDAANPEYFLKCLNKCRSCLLFKFAPPEIRENKEVVLKSVKWLDSGFMYVSHKLRGNKEFAIKFLNLNTGGLKYLSEALRHDRDILTLAVSLCGYDFRWVPKEYRHDYELNKLAVDNGCSLVFLSERYKNKAEFKLQAVKKNVHTLSVLNKRQRTEEVILTAILHHGDKAEFYLSEEMKLNPTIQLALKSKEYASMLLDLHQQERKQKNAKSNS